MDMSAFKLKEFALVSKIKANNMLVSLEITQ